MGDPSEYEPEKQITALFVLTKNILCATFAIVNTTTRRVKMGNKLKNHEDCLTKTIESEMLSIIWRFNPGRRNQDVAKAIIHADPGEGLKVLVDIIRLWDIRERSPLAQRIFGKNLRHQGPIESRIHPNKGDGRRKWRLVIYRPRKVILASIYSDYSALLAVYQNLLHAPIPVTNPYQFLDQRTACIIPQHLDLLEPVIKEEIDKKGLTAIHDTKKEGAPGFLENLRSRVENGKFPLTKFNRIAIYVGSNNLAEILNLVIALRIRTPTQIVALCCHCRTQTKIPVLRALDIPAYRVDCGWGYAIWEDYEDAFSALDLCSRRNTK